MSDLKNTAMNITSQLLDFGEVPVEKKQEINDQCDAFVEIMLRTVLKDELLWKEKAIIYLQDLEKLMTLVGNHTYASHLQIFIKK